MICEVLEEILCFWWNYNVRYSKKLILKNRFATDHCSLQRLSELVIKGTQKEGIDKHSCHTMSQENGLKIQSICEREKQQRLA